MHFLLENERAYMGASNLYDKLRRLNINPALYELPVPYIFKPVEVLYWTDSMLNDIQGKPISEETQDIRRICASLQKWARSGYIIHVL